MTRRSTIVVAATPTPNGDLHVGHLAGPYLAGDVHVRYLRALGRPVLYTTCTDDSQTYVVSTAHRRGTSPAALCAASTAAIERSLSAMGISMPGLPPIDDRYRETVLDFVTALHDAGRFRLRTVVLPHGEHSGTPLFDGLVGGFCPVCLAPSCGGACEECGHPNNFDELIAPRSTLDPAEPVGRREHQVLVLPLEDYRDRLTAYFAARQGRWRPHSMQLIQELLARPLPEVPITIPGTHGIPAPFPQTPGQVVYPWVEAMPASMYATWWAAAQAGDRAERTDEHWRAEHDAQLVYFHGYDNTYHWGLLDLVLLMAHGDYVLPEVNICNEFYDLDGEKFSTSRNHLIRAADLLAELPRDLVRFYLALTGPENQRTNFTREALREVVARRLVEPWNALADSVSLRIADLDDDTPRPTTPDGRLRAAAMVERFRLNYELAHYSAARAAETLAGRLARLRATADTVPAAGDLLLEVRTLLACASPILIDVAERAAAAGVDLDLAADPPHEIRTFHLPRLPAVPDGEPSAAPVPAVTGGRS